MLRQKKSSQQTQPPNGVEITRTTELAVKYLLLTNSKGKGKKKMRSYGEGRIFLRGRIYHIAYCRTGMSFSESERTPDEKKARKLLAQRLGQKEKPEFVGPSEKRLTLDDLEAEIVADYERNGKRSLSTALYCLKPVKEFFKYNKLVEITRPRIQEYQTERLKAGMARATVNREVRYLLRGFKLLVEPGWRHPAGGSAQA